LIEAICYLESWGDPNAQSSTGPKGIMQISAATAVSMGLKVTYATRYKTSREKVPVKGKRGKTTYKTVTRKTPYKVLVRDERALPDVAMRAPAVQLLVDRACDARHDFELRDDSVAAAVQLCRRLDGIPLAIELAAARVRSMSLGEIAERLDQRFRLLKGATRTAVERHSTLRRVVDWSYDLLSDDERTVLRRLSVFAGGCSEAAAERVVAGDPVDAIDVLVTTA